jgi:uncharacterized protein YoxC
MTVIEMSAAVVALTCLGLGLYLFFVLREMREVLNRTNHLLSTLEPHLGPLVEEACQLTKITRHLASNFEHSARPFFNAITDVGEDLEHRAALYKKKSELKQILREEEPITSERHVNRIVDLIELGVIFWQTFKKRRS